MEENNATTPSSGGMNPMLIVGLIVVVAVVGIGIVFANNKGATNTTTTPTAPAAQESMTAETSPTAGEAMSEDSSEVKTFEVSGANFRFDPAEIKVKKGDRVKVVFTAKDMQHDFDIDELDVDSAVVKAGESTTVEFTADKAGEFEYYCSVGNHRANGMVGTLIVEE